MHIPEEQKAYLKVHEEISPFLEKLEGHFGKHFNAGEHRTLFNLYAGEGVPLDLIEVVVLHCKSQHNLHMRYVEKYIAELQTNGITSKTKYQWMMQRSRIEKQLLKALGYREDLITEQMRQCMDKWITHYGLELETLIRLCKEAKVHTQHPNMLYADELMRNQYDERLLGARRKDQETIGELQDRILELLEENTKLQEELKLLKRKKMFDK